MLKNIRMRWHLFRARWMWRVRSLERDEPINFRVPTSVYMVVGWGAIVSAFLFAVATMEKPTPFDVVVIASLVVAGILLLVSAEVR
jgi:hypothetical protein